MSQLVCKRANILVSTKMCHWQKCYPALSLTRHSTQTPRHLCYTTHYSMSLFCQVSTGADLQ